MGLFRLAFKIVGLVISGVVIYAAVTFGQVWWASRQTSASSASAIVVMGAAQYNGHPSPVLKARLDHAADLYRTGHANLVIVTGGKQPGDRVTQGLTGFDYLRDHGVPAEDIKVEVQGTNSYEELSAASLIIDQAKLPPTALIVSDPYHSLRVSQIADQVGLTPYVSSDGSSPSLRAMARETIAVAVGRIIGYRRLSAFA